jgi:hypothetical protein
MTWLLQFVGSLARIFTNMQVMASLAPPYDLHTTSMRPTKCAIFTNMQEVGDPFVIFTFVLGAVLAGAVTAQILYCPGPPVGRSAPLGVSHRKSFLCGSFVWARRALNRRVRRSPVWADKQATADFLAKRQA